MRGRRSRTSKWVTAASPARGARGHHVAPGAVAPQRRVDRARRRRRDAPPRARGSRARSRAAASIRTSSAWASSDLATTSRPEVSRSSRCTMPGALGIVASRGAAAQRLGERGLRVARRRMGHQAGGLVHHEQVVVLVEHARSSRSSGSGRRSAALLERSRPRRPPCGGSWTARSPSTVTRPASISALSGRARRPAPVRDARNASRRGAGVGRRRPSASTAVRRASLSTTNSSTSTPSTMQLSATLKAGQATGSMKSTTAPSRARSMRFPAAPPTSMPDGQPQERHARG